MKLLESTRFEALNNALSFQTGDSTVFGRIESYSCKLVTTEKALYKRFLAETNGLGPHDLQALSPPQTWMDMSPNFNRCGSGDEGIMCDTISTKTLFYLISTLNSSFEPDYDFTNAKVSCFQVDSLISGFIFCLVVWVQQGTIVAIRYEHYQFKFISTGWRKVQRVATTIVDCCWRRNQLERMWHLQLQSRFELRSFWRARMSLVLQLFLLQQEIEENRIFHQSSYHVSNIFSFYNQFHVFNDV